MKSLFALATLLALPALPAAAQPAHMGEPILPETTSRISEHVWEITGFPNIAIIVGTRATLVVDTGLGPKNGATIARVAAKLAPGKRKLFLTTTHFHPEHAAGEPGFPADTVLIRNTVQQTEMEEHGQEMIQMFAGRSAENKALLANLTLRSPDMMFEHEAQLDLGGGVKVKLLWLGGGHTKGDELTLVEPDQTLISGDLVQNNVIPRIFGAGGTPSSWLAVLDKLTQFKVAHVLPDHSPPGDGSLITAEKRLVESIRNQALALKGQGVSVEEAGKQVSAALHQQHPDWADTDAAAFVKSVYEDAAGG